MVWRLALATAAAVALAAADPADVGACGSQCTADTDCTGCGLVGRCSSPAGGTDISSIAASCVDAPPHAPPEPKPDASASVWPMTQYSADVALVTYSDFSAKRQTGFGKIFYDGVNSRLRTDWHPYINGKSQTQIWLREAGGGTSRFYVKIGLFCIYFTAKDTVTGSAVGVQRPDWMQRCSAAGMATYMGREQVFGEWVDHYSCRVLFPERNNESLIFQNWHSLGLGVTPRGTPLRVTGGDTRPSPNSGTPRLQSAFYSNFTVGPESLAPTSFNKPFFCIPVGESEMAAMFGTDQLFEAHLPSHDVLHRAHYLPHTKPQDTDIQRARTKRPRSHMAGKSVHEAMSKLNAHLLAQGAASRSCENFTLAELHGLQRELFAARSPALQDVYHGGDRRALPYASMADLASAHRSQLSAAAKRSDLLPMVRDGLCQESVMIYVHHLTDSAQREVLSGSFQLPLLPERELHQAPAHTDSFGGMLHSDYVAKASCAICHVEEDRASKAVVV